MVKSLWKQVSYMPTARRQRPQLTLGAILILVCALTAACSTTTGSHPGPSSSRALPTVTSSSSTSTASGTATSGSTPSTQSTFSCAALAPLVPVLQAGKLHVTFEMSAVPNLALKGSFTNYRNDAGGLTLKGQGYLVSPNDPIQIQVAQASDSVQITVKDSSTGKVTTYTVAACSTKTSSDIELTGTVPSSFTIDLLITP